MPTLRPTMYRREHMDRLWAGVWNRESRRLTGSEVDVLPPNGQPSCLPLGDAFLARLSRMANRSSADCWVFSGDSRGNLGISVLHFHWRKQAGYTEEHSRHLLPICARILMAWRTLSQSSGIRTALLPLSRKRFQANKGSFPLVLFSPYHHPLHSFTLHRHEVPPNLRYSRCSLCLR